MDVSIIKSNSFGTFCKFLVEFERSNSCIEEISRDRFLKINERYTRVGELIFESKTSFEPSEYIVVECMSSYATKYFIVRPELYFYSPYVPEEIDEFSKEEIIMVAVGEISLKTIDILFKKGIIGKSFEISESLIIPI